MTDGSTERSAGDGVTIRPARHGDLALLYEICLRTADAGEDGTDAYLHPTLPGEIYVGPYVVLDEGIGFVAEDRDGPAGYIVAALDTPAFEAAAEARWWPLLRDRYPEPGAGASTPDEVLMALVHRPEVTESRIADRYPAHLHISLLPRLQGRGVGRALMERLFEEMEGAGVEGIHLGVETRNHRAIRFYARLGFATIEPDGDDGVLMGLRRDGP